MHEGIALLKEPFTPDAAGLSTFNSGDYFWELESAFWLRDSGKDGAQQCIERGECDVWLYRHSQSLALVGFGSLGKTKWKDPKTGKRFSLGLIPYLAVAKEFWGQPPAPPALIEHCRFSYRIMADLMATAIERNESFLGLFVHTSSRRAKAFYEKIGFRDFPHVYTCKESGEQYQAMYISIGP